MGDMGSVLGWKDPLEKGMATLQYSCLENPMDKGAWWAAVHRGHKELNMTERACTCVHTHTHTRLAALADFSSSHRESVSNSWAQLQGISEESCQDRDRDQQEASSPSHQIPT